MASVELGYFGDTFGRPPGESLPWLEGANADMWGAAEETRERIVTLYRRAWAHSDTTIETPALETTGRVPWWPDDRSGVTLHRILVHVTAETHRHAGHADIVRELVDGTVGMQEGNDNMPPGERQWWADHRNHLERTAHQAAKSELPTVSPFE